MRSRTVQKEIASLNKQERAYRLIRQRIETSVYGPGQRLVIDSLARDLEMSQVPIREAIRRLEAEGWVHYHRNSGPEVANVSLEQWQSTMEVLAVLEGYATALAATHLDPDDITRLKDCLQTMRLALRELDLVRYSACNRQFHQAIFARCPNRVLVERISETQAKLDAIRSTLFPLVPRRALSSLAEHERLIASLEAGESFSVVEAMAREHKLHFLRAAARQLEIQDGTSPELVTAGLQ